MAELWQLKELLFHIATPIVHVYVLICPKSLVKLVNLNISCVFYVGGLVFLVALEVLVTSASKD